MWWTAEQLRGLSDTVRVAKVDSSRLEAILSLCHQGAERGHSSAYLEGEVGPLSVDESLALESLGFKVVSPRCVRWGR